MSSTSSTVSRRDAAIAAALAGAVVVVLGYASGLGIVEPATTALAPAPPAAPGIAPEPAATTEPAPAPLMTPMPVGAPAPPLPDPSPAPDHPSHPMPTEPDPAPVPDPSDPPPDPSPDPTAPPGGPECSSVLEVLPVVGPATVPLTSWLADVLATVPPTAGLVPSPATSEDPASLECLLGLGGEACCAAPDSDQGKDAP